MAGRKVFTSGEILTAADVNSYLMDQSVMVFADSSARSSAIPSPTEGMVTYVEDNNRVEVYDGSAFGPIGGILQVVSTTKTDTFSTSSTSFTDVTGLSASITPSSASSKIMVTAVVPVTNSADNEAILLTVTDSSNAVIFSPDSLGSRGAVFAKSLAEGNLTATITSQTLSLLHEPGTTSSFTYKVRARMTGGTGYINRQVSDDDLPNSPRGVATVTLMEVAV